MLRLLGDSLFKPADAFQEVRRLGLSRGVLLQLAALQAVILAILGFLLPAPDFTGEANAAPAPASPIMIALLQFAVVIVTAQLIEHVGRLFGGTGTSEDSLLASVWHALVFFIPSVALQFLVAAGSDSWMLAYLILGIWNVVVMTRFVQAVHGFPGFGMTLIGVIGGSFLLLLVVLLFYGLVGGGNG